MAEARAAIGEFANLPAYTGPGLPNDARNAIQDLAKFAAEHDLSILDKNVEACLPPGCTDVEIYPHGSAYWSRTAGILAKQDGQRRQFFMKLSCSAHGLSNLTGEMASIKVIQEAMPGFTPSPIAVGTYASSPDICFYLASFVDMTDEIPEIDQLAPKFAEMHLKAVSPNGMFGFHVPTNMGACVQQNGWTRSWEKCFSNLISVIFEFEQQVHGHNQEMRDMHNIMMEKVIPRLLRPLETEGRSIEPRFVHGDLWDGNISVDAATDQPVIFDASGMYAHNEYDLGAWNLPRHKVYRGYLQAYQRHFPPSAPEEDVDDRLALYTYRFNLTSSASYLDNMRFRDISIEDMRYLTSKHKDGYQGSAPMKSESSEQDSVQGAEATHL